jgi:hypothetical protein
MPVNRVYGTSATAAALGLQPATVQMYARDGRIPHDWTPGGHRRYDIEEVRAALEANGRRRRMRKGAPVRGLYCATCLVSGTGPLPAVTVIGGNAACTDHLRVPPAAVALS